MLMQKASNILDAIVAFKTKDDGTYNFYTGLPIEYKNGFQVSFVRPEAFSQLSPQIWDDLSNYYCLYFDSIVHIGVYCEDAEVSFLSIDKTKAEKTMVLYNQESILDWEKRASRPEDPNSWFVMNRSFDDKMVIDYDKIIEKIL